MVGFGFANVPVGHSWASEKSSVVASRWWKWLVLDTAHRDSLGGGLGTGEYFLICRGYVVATLARCGHACDSVLLVVWLLDLALDLSMRGQANAKISGDEE